MAGLKRTYKRRNQRQARPATQLRKIDSYGLRSHIPPRNTAKYCGIVEGAKPRSPARQFERCVIASFRIVESMGFKGEFREGAIVQWRMSSPEFFREKIGSLKKCEKAADRSNPP